MPALEGAENSIFRRGTPSQLAKKVLAGAEDPGFVGAPAFRPVKLRQKERALAPAQFANSRMKIRDPLEKSAGAKARNQSNRYRRTKSLP